MNLEDLTSNFKKVKQNNSEFEFEINSSAEESAFTECEDKIGSVIPTKIKDFYKYCDGLTTKNPDMKILRLQDWKLLNNNYIVFANMNNVKICFDSSQINQADEWTIVNPDSKYELTLTMSSFWSNKIWHWIRTQKEIWKDKFWVQEN